MPLQRAGLDAGLSQLLGRACGGRESFDLIAVSLGRLADSRQGRRLPRAGDAVEGQDLIVTREDLVHGGALRLVQVRVVACDSHTNSPARQLRHAVLSSLHRGSSPARARSSRAW